MTYIDLSQETIFFFVKKNKIINQLLTVKKNKYEIKKSRIKINGELLTELNINY